MAKGGYHGGSTIIRPGSGWLTGHKGKRKPKRRPYGTRYAHLSEAELQELIKRAAQRLEKAQADFDAGRMRPPKPKPLPERIGKKRRRKLKLAAKRAKKRAEKGLQP